VLGRHPFRPALIGCYPVDIDTERLGQAFLTKTQRTTLAPDAPTDMPIDRCHG
jgi:hypothetical protein